MGAIITHHGPTTKHKNLSIVYSKNRSIYKSEIVQLREIIKEKSQFPSIEKIVFILFGPPNFPLVRACEYISIKVNLPIFQGFHQEDKVQILQLRQEIETTEAYSNGLIVLNLALYCEDIEILKRYLDSKNMKLCLLFFEIDGETLSNVMNRLDRWVHPSTNRSYHLSSNPPQSYTTSNMLFDDETGDPLIKLPQDTLEGYKNILDNYQLRAMNIYLHHYQYSYSIEGGSTFSQTQRAIMKTLYIFFRKILEEKYSSTIMEMEPLLSSSSAAL